jgi:hypothetical protein
MARKRALTEEQLFEARKLLSHGWDINSIAKKYNVGYHTLYYNLNREERNRYVPKDDSYKMMDGCVFDSEVVKGLEYVVKNNEIQLRVESGFVSIPLKNLGKFLEELVDCKEVYFG